MSSMQTSADKYHSRWLKKNLHGSRNHDDALTMTMLMTAAMATTPMTAAMATMMMVVVVMVMMVMAMVVMTW